MVLNKKGQVALLGLIIGVFIFLLGMSFIDPMKDVLTEVRGGSQLDCTNTSVSDGNKLTCLAVDLVLPYFIVTVLAVAGAWMSAKLVG